MSWTLGGIGVVVAVGLGILVLGKRSHYLEQCYGLGSVVWAQWLPASSAFLLILQLGFSMTSPGDGPLDRYLRLTEAFSIFELIPLVLLSPILLSKFASAASSVFLIYALRKALGGDSGATLFSLPLAIALGAATVIAVLGDRLPWLVHHARFAHDAKAKVRETLVIATSFAAITLAFLSMLRFAALTRWLEAALHANLQKEFVLLLLFCAFGGWLCIALGFAKRYLLPTLAVPLVLTAAFIAHVPFSVLAVPFAGCLALSLDPD